MQKVIIIRGPSGVGKTTVAKKLGAQVHGEYFSIDERIETMQVEGEEAGGIPRKYFHAAQEEIIPKAQQALEVGKPVVLDGNFYWQEQFTQLKEALPYPQHIFTLTASFAVLMERDRSRANGTSVGEDVIRALITLTERLPVGEEIQTKGKSVDEVAGEIVRHII